MFQNVNARAKFENSKYEKRWQNFLLFLFDHNFKCFIKRIINRNATRTFENLLNNYYDWQSTHMSKKNVWMNFEIENFSHCFETFSIILLWKRSCLKKWVKLFHDFQSFKSRVIVEHYFWIMIRNVDFCFVIHSIKSNLRVDCDLIYYKVYSMFKQIFNIFMKNIKTFANFMFEFLFFFVDHIVFWFQINRKNNENYINIIKI